MPNFSQTIICGHLGRDVEQRFLPSGEAVSNFSVAVSESWKSKDGERKESTTWYRVSAFGKLAEICNQYLRKGSAVMIAGKMSERKWKDKDGQERATWELRADTMQMLGDAQPRQQAAPAPAARPQTPRPASSRNAAGGFDDDPDSIPF